MSYVVDTPGLHTPLEPALAARADGGPVLTSMLASDNNLIEVLRREHDLSADEAVAEAVAMRDRCMVLFLRLAELAQS